MNKENIEIIDFGEQFSVLKQYGTDLTKKEYVTNPAIARESEIKKLIMVLLTPEKSGLLVGKAGVGKTAIVEELASRISNGYYEIFKGYKIINIDLSLILSGSKYRGDFEERLNSVIKEVIFSLKCSLNNLLNEL